MALAMATKRTVSVNSARTNVCNRRAVVAHGMVERVASVAVAGGLLFAASPAFALEAQGTQSAQYEQEMMSLISKRQGGKELNLEPKVAPAPPVAVDVLSAEAPLKVDATMSSEERTQIIRAAALKETVIKSAPATKWAPSKPAFSASRSAINTSGGSSNASAVVGLLALVAAAGGAAYYFQINNAPAALVRLLCKELHDIQSNPIDGIRVIANEQNITDVQAEMEGPTGTPFEGGLFKLRLTIPSEYPNVPPKGYFITKVFHPNVSTAGEICVNVLKKDWTADMGIRHVLVVIRCLLVHTNPESALNEEAGRLLLEDYEEFARHAKLMTSIHAQRRPGPLTASGGNANTQPQTDASDKANNSSPASKKAKADQGQNASQPSKASAHPVAAGKVKKSLKRL